VCVCALLIQHDSVEITKKMQPCNSIKRLHLVGYFY